MVVAADDRTSGIRIVGWREATAARAPEACQDEVDAIFFGASNTQRFDNAEARASFRNLWLGQYLAHHPDLAHVASDRDGRIVGYVVAWPDDPAGDPRFGELDYFDGFAALTAHYPAHLHINVSPDWRNAGVGRALVSATVAALQARGAAGLHVTTGVTSRNVRFYLRHGFSAIACVAWRDRRLAFLARTL